MRESYARQSEARIFTELNSIQSGAITAGQVPNGARARVSTGTALPADLRKSLAVVHAVRGPSSPFGGRILGAATRRLWPLEPRVGPVERRTARTSQLPGPVPARRP